MNIGIFIPGFGQTEDDPVLTVYMALVRELRKTHYVRVFAMRYPQHYEPYTIFDDVHVFPFNAGYDQVTMPRAQYLQQLEEQILVHHESTPFDIFHAIWAEETAYMANRLGQHLGIPTVVSLAGGEIVAHQNINYGMLLGRSTSQLVDFSLRNATQIIAPSITLGKIAEQYLRNLNIYDQETLQTVPLGVDTTIFKPPKFDVREIDFLHVASLEPVKRQDYLFDIVEQVPNMTVHIAGDGSLAKYLQTQVQVRGIDDRVIFLGYLSEDELISYYQRAKFLIITSQHEAFCLPALEAYACGMEIIGTPVGVLPEFGQTSPSLEGIIDLVKERKRYFNEDNAAERNATIQRDYSIDSMVAGVQIVYTKAISRKR